MSSIPDLRVLLLLFLFAAPFVEARVGESREDLERRLLRESGRGLEVTDDDLEEFHRGRSPYFEDIQIVDGVEYVIYFKINEDYKPSSSKLWMTVKKGRDEEDKPIERPEGWLLQVAYLNGTSVFERYLRSKPLTEVETNGILSVNAGSSEWVAASPPEGDESVIQPEVFPANHHRKDLGVYANVKEDEILVFDPRLDKRIAQLKLERAKAEAPVSLDGF